MSAVITPERDQAAPDHKCNDCRASATVIDGRVSVVHLSWCRIAQRLQARNGSAA
jgi:hypothetical protein